MAAEGMQFPWRLNRSTISANLELTWEMSVNLGAAALASMIRDREVTASDAVEASLERIEAINPNINAITTVYADTARALAAAADQRQADGHALGPCHGVPLLIKENIDVEGWPTTLGVPAFKDAIAKRDAPIVEQLRAAGAIPIAGTNLPEFALRWHTDSGLYGATRNPWNANLTPGGSSGGAAAALASGMGPLALGNDLGGSLRYPAQCCGVACFKPGQGRIARGEGVLPSELPYTFQHFYVEGIMARHVADLRLAFATASKRDLRDPWWLPVQTLQTSEGGRPRIAVMSAPASLKLDTQVADGVRKAADAMANAGYIVEESEPPHLNEAKEMWQQLVFAETRHLALAGIKQVASKDTIRALELWEFIPDLDRVAYMGMLADRTRLLRDWSAFLDRYPLILGPVSAALPFEVGADLESMERVKGIMDNQGLILAVNLLCLPAAVIPVGVADGMPQAVQIIGAQFNDELCLETAEVLEQAFGAITPIEPR